MSNENRQVYSSTGGDWTYEFTWANMAGSHGDGLEWVNGHLFVSDMTSNFIAMWDYDGTIWSETQRFAYTELGGTNKFVEGMGFGALGHFWAGSGGYVYELGGGEIGDYTDPNGSAPEPGSLLLMGAGLLGLFGLRRKST
ncbi:PEP-CTERM sorting domain-containing protein [Thiolapillus sp.]|uniref:PEP-CTERM sorting domain-containing protein n=1 Tax=Thiolapillus sp. TaxID=2017437 RepID=UPI003AF4B292